MGILLCCFGFADEPGYEPPHYPVNNHPQDYPPATIDKPDRGVKTDSLPPASPVCPLTPLPTKGKSDFYSDFPSCDEEDVCPTCLEEYDFENPKIDTNCKHHFHLGCILAWQERSDRCPVCFKLMEYKESS